jgi:hypothetical protein
MTPGQGEYGSAARSVRAVATGKTAAAGARSEVPLTQNRPRIERKGMKPPDLLTMMDISALIPAVQAKLDKLPEGHALDLRTYKRNRSIIILKKDPNHFLFLENGFSRDRLSVSRDKVKKTLKKMLKKEFPRSRKVRVYDLGPWDEEAGEPPKLKTL